MHFVWMENRDGMQHPLPSVDPCKTKTYWIFFARLEYATISRSKRSAWKMFGNLWDFRLFGRNRVAKNNRFCHLDVIEYCVVTAKGTPPMNSMKNWKK